MASNPALNETAMAGALIAAGGSVEALMKSVEGNTPQIVHIKKDISMAIAAKPAATTKSPIARLYGERVGKKVAIGDFTFLIEERQSTKTNEPTRVLRVVKSKGDQLIDRFLFVHELDYEELAYKLNSPVEIYDDKVTLHAFLRPLAVAAGLAKATQPKASKKHKIQMGKALVAKPVATPLVRMHTVVAPDSQPVSNFGIERLLSAPADKKVVVGAYSFIVEEGDHEQGPTGRRYVCVRAPEDFGLGNWITHDDVCLRTSPRIPDSLRGQLREAKVAMHQLLRDSAIDAGLIQGKYAVCQTAITDQVVCIASIKDAVEGRYIVQHPDYEEDAIIGIELEDGRHGMELQIILIRGNSDGLDGISTGTRIAHKLFMKRLRPARMPQFVEVFADWLDEAVF